MKHTIHSATGQYEFVETEMDETVLAADAIQLHQSIVKVVKGEAGTGLVDKDFNEVLDIYLMTRKMPNGADLYSQMNKEQQSILQHIKRSFKRTDYENR